MLCHLGTTGHAEDATQLRRQLEQDRASLAALQEKIALEEARLARAQDTVPPSPGSRRETAPPAPAADAKASVPLPPEMVYPNYSYSIRLPASFGYDSNVNGLSDQILRPPSLSHRDSTFIFINPSISFTRQSDKDTALDLKYDLQKYYFQEQADSNRTTHTLLFDRTQKFGDNKLTLLATGLIKFVDEEGTAAQATFGPTWLQQWGKSAFSTEFRYRFQVTDFRAADNKSVVVISDPDYTAHILGLTQYFVLRRKTEADPTNQGFQAGIGYNFFAFDADGRDGDEFRHEVQISLTGAPFPASWKGLNKLSVELVYTHDFDQYHHRNSRAGIDVNAENADKLAKITGGFYGRGFEYRRSDNTDDFRVTLAYPLEFGLNWKDKVGSLLPRPPVQTQVATTYIYNRSDSNLPERSKDDHVFRLGLVSDF